ncbi:hypothetical protein R3P38DRAFT_3211899 [Favolaschia claudopus]|uniref:Uncharacterized protein n=1 Tax=Favolaschia claudopus TaxID=2862362 RepID=A0AAW0AFH0_9AGAR
MHCAEKRAPQLYFAPLTHSRREKACTIGEQDSADDAIRKKERGTILAQAVGETRTECKEVERRADDEGDYSCAEGETSLHESSTATGRRGPVPSPVNSHPHSPTIRLLPVPPKTSGNLLPRASQHADGGRRVRQGWYYSRAPPPPTRTRENKLCGRNKASLRPQEVHPPGAEHRTHMRIHFFRILALTNPPSAAPPATLALAYDQTDVSLRPPTSSSHIVAILLPPDTTTLARQGTTRTTG